ncbi:hypothetical protein BS50DRAFT_609548 [Corynespora cassiicola Philippines]|uniref:Xylanolytic transcriptional activator regulatory domain-containing protein n=1 Tax=Corynespora cassiicola Philippines TaxID=1448308 RepID=A0A2T2NQ62_CORCC|nr:hypothetical protein BS50DRAFT_609548 [Corynespora cassiicola Philippines]
MEQTSSPIHDSSQARGLKRSSNRCDVQRPCTLCVRAGVTCAAPTRVTTWRVHEAGRPAKKPRRDKRRASSSTTSEHTPRASLAEQSSDALNPCEGNESIAIAELSAPSDDQVDHAPYTANSASIQYLEEAFQQHETTSPDAAETSSFAVPRQGGAHCSPTSVNASQKRPSAPISVSHRDTPHPSAGASCSAMLSVLPRRDIADLLVENYFDRIHWFVLVFHQSDFRQRLQLLYDGLESTHQEHPSPIGFVSSFIAVCILSLSYMDQERTAKLSELGGHAASLQSHLLERLRSSIMDVAADSSIEAVQTCVLLGSYYVYHGQPQQAWPICGLSLRLAQALKLHRRAKEELTEVPDLDDPRQRAGETRKRCWWAVYEIETFCSMLYGYPLSINDDDCDVGPLHQYPERSRDPTWNVAMWRSNGQATLLSYKVAMAGLSVIVRAALLDLYSLRASSNREGAGGSTTSAHMRSLTKSVNELNKKLDAWSSQLPRELQVDRPRTSTATPCEDYLQNRLGSCSNACYHYLFPLQSLSLKLALENAKILVHRPLLSYRMSTSRVHHTKCSMEPPDPCQLSIQICQDAALQISAICSTPVVKDAGATHAVAFICLHLLTASITLSILAILRSMTPSSHECKMGLRQLMGMQLRLSSKSVIARQGFSVSKKLMSLLLEKEMKEMLDIPAHDDFVAHTVAAEQRLGVSSRGCSDLTNNTRQNPDLTGPDDSCIDGQILETGLGGSTDTNPQMFNADDSFFYEDPTIMQALFDFEQAAAVTELPSETSIHEYGPNPQASINVSAQDYSWIWNSNFDSCFP